RHNAYGHRIARQTYSGRPHHDALPVHYLYLDNRLVAEAGARHPGGNPVITRRYLYAGLTPVGMIEYPKDAAPTLYAVHADLAGAPRLITDADRRIRWLAHYSPTGRAQRVTGD